MHRTTFFGMEMKYGIHAVYLVIQLCQVVCIIAHQASLSMGFPRQEYWSGLPFPPPGDCPHPGIKPKSPALQADSLPTEPPAQRLNASWGTDCKTKLPHPICLGGQRHKLKLQLPGKRRLILELGRIFETSVNHPI